LVRVAADVVFAEPLSAAVAVIAGATTYVPATNAGADARASVMSADRTRPTRASRPSP
jgi:hypothetical protein